MITDFVPSAGWGGGNRLFGGRGGFGGGGGGGHPGAAGMQGSGEGSPPARGGWKRGMWERLGTPLREVDRRQLIGDGGHLSIGVFP